MKADVFAEEVIEVLIKRAKGDCGHGYLENKLIELVEYYADMSFCNFKDRNDWRDLIRNPGPWDYVEDDECRDQ